MRQRFTAVETQMVERLDYHRPEAVATRECKRRNERAIQAALRRIATTKRRSAERASFK